MNDEVRQELRGAALWVTIDRKARRNAINAQVIAGLQQALERARRDPAVRALVLTGAGDAAFCAGADLQGNAFEFDASQPELEFADLLRAAHRATVPEGQIGLAAFTEDARERVKAFRERREPVWTGR